jgi:hypothetical protein
MISRRDENAWSPFAGRARGEPQQRHVVLPVLTASNLTGLLSATVELGVVIG